VLAGDGLIGGGSSGAVSLGVDFAGTGLATTVARSDHRHGAALLATRAFVSSEASLDVKDAACAAEFGPMFLAASPLDVAAHLPHSGATADVGLGRFVTTAARLTDWTYTERYSFPGEAGSGEASLACVRRDRLLAFARAEAISADTDAAKDAACTAEFGAGYRAAGLLDVLAAWPGPVATPTSWAFSVAGHAGLFRWANGSFTPDATAAASLACVRVVP
jgi:hypothetical protein